jgi:hypothetical protein
MQLARSIAGIAAVFVGVASARAQRCPTLPDDPVCRPWSAVLLPTLYATFFKPNEGSDYYGGGLEAILLAWSDNSEAFGPSQGRVRFDIGALDGIDMDAGPLAMYRIGAQVSFERNASRAYLIPYFAADVGGLWSDATGRRWFVDGGLGVYLVHGRSMIVDLEVTGVLPFRDPGQLGGVSSRLGVSYALW